MVAGSLRLLWLLPPLKTGRHDIAEILLKVALNTINQFNHLYMVTLMRVVKTIPGNILLRQVRLSLKRDLIYILCRGVPLS